MGKNRQSPHNLMTKHKATREAELLEHVIEAIAYMEYQPSTSMNVKCRRQLREVAGYLRILNDQKNEAQ